MSIREKMLAIGQRDDESQQKYLSKVIRTILIKRYGRGKHNPESNAAEAIRNISAVENLPRDLSPIDGLVFDNFCDRCASLYLQDEFFDFIDLRQPIEAYLDANLEYNNACKREAGEL